MKRLFLVLALLIIMATPVIAGESIICGSLGASGYVLATGETLTFDVSRGSDGFFVVQPTFTTSGGTLKVEYQTSTLRTYWSPVVEIVAAAVSSTEYRYPAAGVNIFSGNQRVTFTAVTADITFQEIGRCSQ